MKIDPAVFEAAEKDHVDFVEAEANKLLAFRIESSNILRSEAHATLQWLVAVAVASAGYLVTLLSKGNEGEQQEWWLIVGLALVAGAAAISASLLIRCALLTKEIYPIGNEPKHLITGELIRDGVTKTRLIEVSLLQERIDVLKQHNDRVGDAIDRARRTLALLPLGALAALACSWFTFS